MSTSAEERAHLSPELNELPHGRPPLAQACWLHGTQPGEDQVRVIASQSALRQIVAHGGSDLNRELGGALLGKAYRQGGRVFVEIAAALPAQNKDHGPVHFTFTADSWAELHQHRATAYPDLDIVGWYHTHPNLGVFYSGDDVVVHSAAFTLPWHVGLVIDPVRSEVCFFGWVNGSLASCSGFYEQHEEETQSAIPWNYVQSTVWQGHDDPGAYQYAGSRVATPPNSWFGFPSAWAPMALIAGASALLFGFFLLGAWVFTLNRQIDRLESVVVMLASETQADTNAAVCPDPRLRLITPVTGSRVGVGSRVAVIGVADLPTAARYRVEIRPSESTEWNLVDMRRRDASFNQLAEWDTAEYPPATYELRLTAVDGNNIIIAGTAECVISLELVP